MIEINYKWEITLKKSTCFNSYNYSENIYIIWVGCMCGP